MRSWELTQVNELLVQMEQFEGLFVCATNLIDTLDQASLRRFALKVKFDWLRPEQVEELFAATVKAPVDGVDREFRAALARMRHLTPGDFAAVTRRLSLLGEPVTTPALFTGLREEITLKRTGGSVVGFH